MTDERSETTEVREFRLEGMTLVVAAVVLIAALAGTFQLGRWFERGSRPAGAADAAENPLAHVAQAEEPADVDSDAGFFDTVGQGSPPAEPGRQARQDAGGSASEPATESSPGSGPAPATAGDFFVQVWAGRDREAAEVMVGNLQREGYPVKVISDRVEGDTLYKVRVGGFETEARAREMAGELERKGYRGAWVTHQP